MLKYKPSDLPNVHFEHSWSCLYPSVLSIIFVNLLLFIYLFYFFSPMFLGCSFLQLHLAALSAFL